MEIKKIFSFVLLLLVLGTPSVYASAIGDFLDGIAAPVTRTFDGVNKFLIQLKIVGLNVVEVLLFVVFVMLLLAVFIVPARLYKYVREGVSPIRRFLNWVRR